MVRHYNSPSTVCKYMVSSSISLPSSGFFSSFPHGTCALSVSKEYLALEGGPPRFRQNFTCSVLLRILPDLSQFRLRGLSLSLVQLPRQFVYQSPLCESYNPNQQADWFGLFRVRSPLLAESQLISFPSGT